MKFSESLVLGATGRLGQILRRHGPVSHVRWQSRRDIAEDGWTDAERACWHVLDPLSDPVGLAQAADGCATILCLAGTVPGRGGDLADNIHLAEAAVRAGAEVGARVLLASSAAVYGARQGVLSEDLPTAPVAAYGRAKAEMEAQAADLGARLGVRVSALRIGNVAGCDAILGGWHPGFKLHRFADGSTPRRSYIGPVTLARVLGDVLCKPDLPEVLNIAAPGVVGMGALLDAAALPWRATPAPPEAIAEVHLSTRLLQGFTSLTAADSLPQALVWEWQEVAPDTWKGSR